jgi:thermospermine synthase
MFTFFFLNVCRDPRLELIHDDARAQLEKYPGTFDVIIGDLADPVFGGPCYQLYTDDFYKNVVAKKLNAGGIFATQSGPCGLMTAGEVFSSIHSTLKASFDKVVPYQTHIPAFADVWVCSPPSGCFTAVHVFSSIDCNCQNATVRRAM